MRALHWFRNDLRLRDNRALTRACRADALVPLFVFDPRLMETAGPPRLRFVLDCLERLDADLERRGSRLIVREGRPAEVLPEIAVELGIERVTFGRDYSPFSKSRDRKVRERLEAAGVEVVTTCDRVVHESDAVLTAAGGHYSVFSPYARAWWRRFEEDPPEVAGVARIPRLPRVPRGKLPTRRALAIDGDQTKLPTGGEAAARRRLARFLADRIGAYETDRDLPARDGTSRLSPCLRFGALSVRECFRAGLTRLEADPVVEVGARKWLDELVWREFYQAILDRNPHVLDRAYRSEFDGVEWNDDPAAFDAWCAGRTGFPLVDAGMRELLASGTMHNRVRMVVASFLTKDLLIDWRRGARWFMERLVDGDPASNNGGWQWAASTGTDPQPYFRIFNPTRQAERYDPDGDYVRRWVPELRRLEGASAHRPWESPLLAPGYPEPIVDHAERRDLAIARYRAARQRARARGQGSADGPRGRSTRGLA